MLEALKVGLMLALLAELGQRLVLSLLLLQDRPYAVGLPPLGFAVRLASLLLTDGLVLLRFCFLGLACSLVKPASDVRSSTYGQFRAQHYLLRSFTMS